MKSNFLKGNLIVLMFLPLLVFSKNADIDVLSYDIQLHVSPESKYIHGDNLIKLAILKPGETAQFKLFPNLTLSQIILNGQVATFERKGHFIFVNLDKSFKKGDTLTLKIGYQGNPTVAKNAPWDGGFVWSQDSAGNPWIGMACEGLGASSWLPCKDTWDDEPSRVTFTLFVPNGLTAVSNGRLVRTEKKENETSFTWQVNNPINHYNIAINIGKYAHIQEAYISATNDTLDLDFYVLEKNYGMAKTHFQQSKRMLKAFEHFFGKYPFYEDGYKLVETPYWGMEHQSCVAYGNNYENNHFGFDFIIIHESGHEWFANSLTAKDKADMWIHESFTTYSESLFIEYYYGKARAIQYLLEQKAKIKNEAPMIGLYGTNHKFNDNDIYYKGAWMLHTLRHMIDNDTLWLNTLRDLNKRFYHQTVSSEELEQFLSERTRLKLGPFFDQYLRQESLPVLEYYIVQRNDLNELHYRLASDVKGLEMPLLVTLAKERYDFITAENGWKVIDLPYENAEHFKLEETKFLVKIKQVKPKK
jgi:aminopeptidase N